MRCRECQPLPEEVARAVDLLGRRWTLAIVWASAEAGAVRFNEFKQTLDDPSSGFGYVYRKSIELVSGQAHSPEDIAGLVVKTTQADQAVRIGDIAAVLPSVQPVYTIVTARGKPAVLLNINRQPDSNTVEVANAVHTEIESIRKSLPPGVVLTPFYDQSEIVSDSIKSVRDAILIGLLLASIIMVLFLRDWGTSLVAGLVIPATLLITFIVLRLTGQSFNLMTLGFDDALHLFAWIPDGFVAVITPWRAARG